MFNLTGDPIYVHVQPHRWDSYGSKTFRAHFLVEYLKRVGISVAVPPGWYDFNMMRRGLKLYSRLIPHVE